MPRPSSNTPCPCFSGRTNAVCCKPLHEGLRDAETPEALMRARYAAFALGRGDYLVKTLAKGHADRTTFPDLDALARTLSRAKDRQRYLGLRIDHASAEGDRGEVTFHARIFERGVDRSFGERSFFVREDGAWRYASGELLESNA